MSDKIVKLTNELLIWFNKGFNDALTGLDKNTSNKTDEQQRAYDDGFKQAMVGEY